jgi:hypothetical protein
MKSVRVALSAFGGAFLLASSAMAADMAAVPPPLWAIYFGGGVCYDWAKFEGELGPNDPGYPYHVRSSASAPCLTAEVGVSTEINNGYFDVSLSYDWQKKRGETEVDFSTGGPPNWQPVGEFFELGNMLTLAGRAGVKTSPDLILYALLGYSWAKYAFEPVGPGTPSTVHGPTFGLGLESRFDPNWSGRLEARHTIFNTFQNHGELPNIHLTDTSIRALLIYRFTP